MSNPDYQTILLKLCASLTQVDHMGAAWEQVGYALGQAGIPLERGGNKEIAKVLGQMGVTTFSGAKVISEYVPYYD